jgi:hypothetical protein
MDLAVPHCLAPSRVDCAELHRTVCDPIRSAPSCAVSRCAALRCARCVPCWSGLFQLRAALAPNHAVPSAFSSCAVLFRPRTAPALSHAVHALSRLGLGLYWPALFSRRTARHCAGPNCAGLVWSRPGLVRTDPICTAPIRVEPPHAALSRADDGLSRASPLRATAVEVWRRKRLRARARARGTAGTHRLSHLHDLAVAERPTDNAPA